MLPANFVIRNVRVWNPDGVKDAQDLWVSGGRIAQVSPTGTPPQEPYLKLAESVDAEGLSLLPAGIDLQVHLRVPGQPEKETPETGLRAALRGGFGAILTMPNTNPVIDSRESLELGHKAVAEFEKRYGVRVLWSAAMTVGQQGREVVDAKSLKDAGVVALTDDGKGVARDEVMLEVFRASAATGLPVLQHAEVPGHGASLAAGKTQAQLGLKAYPSEAEWGMVERDIRLLKQTPGARYHVLHVSSKKTVELIRAAKKEGLAVSGEVTPHHLYFTSNEIPPGNSDFKMNPPLRSADDRDALIEGLADGTLNFVATDHAPHEKSKKGPDFSASAFGTTGLETALRVLLKLVKEGRLTTGRMVEVFSTAPAQFIGLEAEYGRLEAGRPFRAVWLDDRAAPRALEVSELESLSKNNCFLGAPLPGRIRGVFNEAGLFRFGGA